MLLPYLVLSARNGGKVAHLEGGPREIKSIERAGEKGRGVEK